MSKTTMSTPKRTDGTDSTDGTVAEPNRTLHVGRYDSKRMLTERLRESQPGETVHMGGRTYTLRSVHWPSGRPQRVVLTDGYQTSEWTIDELYDDEHQYTVDR